MFCRNCGQPIEDDSKYCKHCGASVEQSSKDASPKSIRNLYDKFVSLPSRWQTLILCYLFWVLGWICVVIITGIEGSSEDYGVAMFFAFLAIVVLPFIVFAISHIVKLQKSKKKSVNSASNEPIDTQKHLGPEEPKEEVITETPLVTEEPEVNYGKIIEKFTLKEFSLLYGKMQVKKVMLENGSLQSYCTFTNGEVKTKVEFDRKLGPLSAMEISARKEELCIIEYENKKNVLTGEWLL